MTALVSVVLPIRFVNNAWLRQSISSVLEQDYPNLELIIVNDKATEDIDDLILSFGIKKYVKNDRNRKLPYSLNRGFEIADGAYHTWTSADNFMLPGMVTRLVKELEERDLSIVCGRSCMVDERDAILDMHCDEETAKLASCDLNDNDIPPRFTYYSSLGACFLYRREVWECLNGYDEKRHGSEDFDFWVRASRSFKMGRIPWREKPLYVYRIHSDSMSSTVHDCFTGARLKIVNREARRYPNNEYLKSAVEYYRSLEPRRGINEIIRTSVFAPIYARALQHVPPVVKKRVRSFSKDGKLSSTITKHHKG
jgi:glycosyltransferase involved in cell wall biosynthesis